MHICILAIIVYASINFSKTVVSILAKLVPEVICIWTTNYYIANKTNDGDMVGNGEVIPTLQSSSLNNY